jgi:hypothetical protein
VTDQTPATETPATETPAPKPSGRQTERKLVGRQTERELVARYPHIVLGSLRWDELKAKQVVHANLACGHEHEVATSDLFQVTACPACREGQRKAARKARKAARRELLASLA